MTSPISIGLNCSCPSHNDQCCPRILRVRWCCLSVDEDKEVRVQNKLKDMVETVVQVESSKAKNEDK